MSIEVQASAELAPQEQIPAEREATLRTLLGADYDYARESGLIDMFAYYPETGEDGLVHLLAGDYEPGTTVPRGFHHAPSGAALWPSMIGPDGQQRPITRKLPEENKQPAFPMEPSLSKVAIGGLKKTAVHTDKNTGEVRVADSKNSMFPDEYDALAVMQAIRIAREHVINPDTAQKNPEKPFYYLEGKAPLIDGKSHMTIRMGIDRKTDKIVTAFPKTNGKPIMGLTEAEMWQHIFTPHSR